MPALTRHSQKKDALKVADAVWVATASLHQRYPDTIGFSPAAICEEVSSQRLTDKDETTTYQHVIQHLVANKPKNPNRRRMLTEVGAGLRRLYIVGDPCHPSKQSGQLTPAPEDLTPPLRHWLSWYEKWSRNHSSKRRHIADDPLLALVGTWKYGDADDYVKALREGWD
jgi:hypothetical protein